MINIANDLDRLALVTLFARDRHRLLNQMCRLHHSVSMQLPVALDVADAVIILVDVGVGAEVGITWTLAYRVADLLARLAFLLLLSPELLLLLGLLVFEFFFVDVFGLVLGELAARLLFASLATAPPHFAAPF